jgi:hypothetical protein
MNDLRCCGKQITMKKVSRAGYENRFVALCSACGKKTKKWHNEYWIIKNWEILG